MLHRDKDILHLTDMIRYDKFLMQIRGRRVDKAIRHLSKMCTRLGINEVFHPIYNSFAQPR